MATSEKLLTHLRRRRFREISSLSNSLSFAVPPPISHRSLINPNSHYQLHHHGLFKSRHNLYFPSNLISLAPFSFSHSRSFSSGDSDYVGTDVAVESAIESIPPVRFLVSLLDGYHDVTGWPWWIIIASSTLALRIALFPILVLQLKKMKRIAELLPKLPPPLPPPLSGRSYFDQISLFRKEKRAIGCPSFLWFLASLSTQVPCFILWMMSIRWMSLDHHPGFDSGGALWFQNLTEFPNGVLGPIFPILISGLHFINVQISFSTSSVGQVPGLLGLLAKYYKFYLEILTVPIFFTGFYIPQGSLVYWVTNSSLSAIQQLTIRHPTVRAKLGLPDKQAPNAAAKEMHTPGEGSLGPPTKQQYISPESVSPQELPGIKSMYPRRKQHQIPIESLSPRDLIALSVQILSKGDKDGAIPFIRMALDKDPNYVRALVVMGQTLLQKEQVEEASDYLERAVTKLFLIGHPTEDEVDLMILASQWAGAACVRQGKTAEGLVHLERIANLKEPDEPKSKAHYFDGLLLLASTLYREGRNAEAAKHLRKAAAYNPAYKEYLEECEREDGFVNDLVSSRRGDY
ncbi:hypothetical protein AAG906_013567 [Vitis piasezkii]|uniref:ALBINO3-like protein 2, chloroplastic n=2 Tax=Vitis vinifera TaxID=29760 RepID=D7SPT7_VITVI|eukprot:XP_002273357.1 PREDICTED: ALBINO3-like protein 2, chloroplastic [Vitis vinifera]